MELPEVGRYATGILFLDENTSRDAEDLFTQLATELGLQVCTCTDGEQRSTSLPRLIGAHKLAALC